jgi:cytoskeletal protein CcmA (bactofilin family)
MTDIVKGMDPSAKKTLVEEGTQFKGSLSSTCPIVVKGKIEGDVTAPSLQVSETGAVRGKVKVGEMQSQGELAGEFDADVVQLSGVVRDKTIVRAKSLEVKLAPATGKMQVVFGECVLDVGDMPRREDAISASREGARPPAAAAASSVPPKPAPSSPPQGKREEAMIAAPSGEASGEALDPNGRMSSWPSPTGVKRV